MCLCPRCKSSNVKTTSVGYTEKAVGFVLGAATSFAIKSGISALTGGRVPTKRLWVNSKAIREAVPVQYECKRCGYTFHKSNWI